MGEHVVVAMDKFRSTAVASELATAIAGCGVEGTTFDVATLSDGGEGFRSAFRGDVVSLQVRDPWGEWHEAPLTLVTTGYGVLGVIEVAEIIGRSRRRAPTSNEALAASSAGVGDAIVASASWGVTHVVVGCGGSATSDGGEGCYEVLLNAGELGISLSAATDIDAEFLGALRYAEQKGVARSDLAVVQQRLEKLADRYERQSGLDVRHTARTGAAGGLSGALFALGANLVSGLDEVVNVNNLAARMKWASTIITGEGRFDAGSLEGKVVSGVCALTTEGQRVLVVCGSSDIEAVNVLIDRYPWVRVVDLVSRFGERRALSDTIESVAQVAREFLVDY
ncbi:MAG: hypothetical protein HKL85_00225 [Acidimicrobiaceae bacterium]|nr:hypothetical protein [Acidimicrobiaceae bacterium]